MQKNYKFNPSDYNGHGINRKSGKFILRVVREWEQDFHHRFFPLFADSLCANYFTIHLIQNCISIGNQENRGIEAFEGAFYFGKKIKAKNCVIVPRIVYAIGSQNDVDKPIWFVRDQTIANGMAILTNDSDSDDDTDSADEYVYDKNPIIYEDAKRIKVR